MTNKDLVIGGAYNFKNQPERLKYIGTDKGWHQFELVGKQGVWAELLDTDLHMIEETMTNKDMPDVIYVEKGEYTWANYLMSESRMSEKQTKYYSQSYVDELNAKHEAELKAQREACVKAYWNEEQVDNYCGFTAESILNTKVNDDE